MSLRPCDSCGDPNGYPYTTGENRTRPDGSVYYCQDVKWQCWTCRTKKSEVQREAREERGTSHMHHLGGLFAPSNGTQTSREAARAVTESGQQATQLAQVLRLINKAGKRGTTRADIAHALGKPQSTICARVNRLMQEGAVIETETPRLPDCGGSIRQKVLVGAI